MVHRRRSRITFLALIFPLIGFVACGDSVTGEDDDDDIRGVWSVQAGQFVTYLEITDSSISVYLGSPATCFERIVFDIVSTDGDTYTLGQDGVSGTQALIIRRSGAQLEVRDVDDPNVAAVYNSASQDLTQLEICTGGGADPALVCEDLPQVDPGEPTAGSLSTDDPTSVYGSHFDLYSLQLESAGEVRIDLTSRDFDSYLLVYLSDGTLIADNDDLDDATRDASLTLDLNPGCYRIEATSFSAGETGGYALSVE